MGSTVFLLNTGATVVSRNYSFPLPSSGKDVATIFVQGNSSDQGSPDNDAYGLFNAKYTWNAYFDPATGYIVGYSYVEQDTNSSGDGFTWTDNLYVTSTSYPLTSTAGTATGSTERNRRELDSRDLVRRRGDAAVVEQLEQIPRLCGTGNNSGGGRRDHHLCALEEEPEGASEASASSDYRPPPPPPADIDLIPREAPAQQIVIKEVAKVKCKFCGAMIDSTAAVCPRCGAPNN